MGDLTITLVIPDDQIDALAELLVAKLLDAAPGLATWEDEPEDETETEPEDEPEDEPEPVAQPWRDPRTGRSVG